MLHLPGLDVCFTFLLIFCVFGLDTNFYSCVMLLYVQILICICSLSD